jgi:hypothetical protein
VRRGLDILRDRGCPFVVVVGHPEYYPASGSSPPLCTGSQANGRACPMTPSWW